MITIFKLNTRDTTQFFFAQDLLIKNFLNSEVDCIAFNLKSI